MCHRYTLLRPDLSRCGVLGDSMHCARCDLALAYLNEHEELGDYQMGALPDQLDADGRRALAALLDEGEPAGVGRDYADLDAAFDVRQTLDGRRAEAFVALDRILAPTEFLAHQLRQGGVEPERISVLGYGIDRTPLEGLVPVRAEAPLRLGYLSGLGKHKGLHVLLEAFGRLNAPAELTVYGGSTDRPYVERMGELASRVGATWRGPFERADLPGILAELDVVVVPSTWYENQPIVILEAFAAGRPVVVPRVGTSPRTCARASTGCSTSRDDPTSLARCWRGWPASRAGWPSSPRASGRSRTWWPRPTSCWRSTATWGPTRRRPPTPTCCPRSPPSPRATATWSA